MKSGAKRKLVFLGLLLFCIIILVSPVYLRHLNSDDYLIGDKPYYYLRIANYINETNAPIFENINDNFSFEGREYSEEIGWPYLLSFNPVFLSFYLPIILGILSFILFYLILNRINYNLSIAGSLLFISSPSFIYLFTISNKYGISIFLSLLAVYLYINKKELLSCLCIPLIGFFSLASSIFLLSIYLIYSIFKKEKLIYFYLSLILTFLAGYMQFGKLTGVSGLFFVNRGFSYFLQNLVSDFGGRFGIGIFMILLAFIGIFILWKDKYRFVLIYLLFLALLSLSYFFDFIIFYLNILIVILVGLALISLYQMRWENNYIKFLIILILICGLIFSSVSFINRLVGDEPRKELNEGIFYLSRQPDDYVAFSHYTRGDWIAYAGKKNVMDSNFFNAPDLYGRFYDSDTLLHTQDINTALEIVKKYNINYIFIDKEMKSGLVWNDDNSELLFILKNDKRFKKAFDNNYVEIWRVEDVFIS